MNQNRVYGALVFSWIIYMMYITPQYWWAKFEVLSCVEAMLGSYKGENVFRDMQSCSCVHSTAIFTPRTHARARGYVIVIGRGVHIAIVAYICKDFFLSFKILTFRRPFQHRKASLRI